MSLLSPSFSHTLFELLLFLINMLIMEIIMLTKMISLLGYLLGTRLASTEPSRTVKMRSFISCLRW